MIHARKTNPRAEYRLAQSEKINSSALMVEKFPKLKSLKIDIEYFDPKGLVRNGGMKYKPNLANARSMLYFNCPHSECVGGDFDLSELLTGAVGKKKKVLEGEMRCQGIRHNRERKDRTPCQNLLRYKLSLGY